MNQSRELSATEREMLDTLRQIADAEGGEMFMGWPDRWWADAHWRCEHGHVSTRVLRSEALGRDACLACFSPVALTFPEDHDGPLVLGDGPSLRSGLFGLRGGGCDG